MAVDRSSVLESMCPNNVRGCFHMPGFVIVCGYDEATALASVGPGWADLVRAGLAAVAGVGYLDQVKEKYARLCLYASTNPGTSDEAAEAMFDTLHALETRSLVICETCGAPGVCRGESWYFTACDEHSKGQAPTKPYRLRTTCAICGKRRQCFHGNLERRRTWNSVYACASCWNLEHASQAGRMAIIEPSV